MAGARTALGNPRIAFSAFGFFHPLMPLIPPRDIVRQIAWHRDLIQRAFGVEASRVLFPPETAFHVRMIPALIEAGVTAVIYDSIHRFRACRDYPYAGIGEGMLPPNAAEQVNPPVDDWLQLQQYLGRIEDLAAPAAARIRGLRGPGRQAPQDHRRPGRTLYRQRGRARRFRRPAICGRAGPGLRPASSRPAAIDPAHPPFFLLHSDGDNHGGGADSYYRHNTGRLVEWLQQDSRFELTTIEDYLQRFPPDPAQVVHIEPGSWAGADNGDPQFMKWFSRYDQPYSPDLNSWAVLTAFQNAVHTLEDSEPDHPELAEAIRLLLDRRDQLLLVLDRPAGLGPAGDQRGQPGARPDQVGARRAGRGRPRPQRTDHLRALGDAGESGRQALGTGLPAAMRRARASRTPSSPIVPD